MIKLRNTRIVTGANATFNERRAAAWISKYIRILTGAPVETVRDATAAIPGEIIVGRTSRPGDTDFDRATGKEWEYRIFQQGGSLYISGLGVKPEKDQPYDSSYRIPEDGCIGTVIAAYDFVRTVLGCDFLNEAYVNYPFNPEAEIPGDYAFDYTRQKLLSSIPAIKEGPLVACLDCGHALDWNMSGTIIKTANGELIVIDGGRIADAAHFIEVLEYLSDGKKPVISLWLFTHLHVDHYGTPVEICRRPDLRSRIEVKQFCHHLLSPAYYTGTPKEKAPADILNARDALLDFGLYFPGCRVTTVNAGDCFDVDGVKFEVLRVPDEAKKDLMDYNDTSVVYRMEAEGQSWLWLADAEWVASGELMQLPPEKLKADVVQVGHHGCGNVSREIYERIGAKASIWHTGPKFLYSERGEGLNTHNTGVIRTRYWTRELGIKPENEHIVKDEVFSCRLPLEIK